jgi:hypothetical protein
VQKLGAYLRACRFLALFGHAGISAIRLLSGGKRPSPWLVRHARSAVLISAASRCVGLMRKAHAPAKFESTHEAALGAIVKTHIKEAAN